MFEFLRKLTADYTEDEYVAWLHELGPVYKEKKPTISENEHIKDIAVMLTEVACDTGYEPEYLYERYDECFDDGYSRKEAFDFVAGVSYERDW